MMGYIVRGPIRNYCRPIVVGQERWHLDKMWHSRSCRQVLPPYRMEFTMMLRRSKEDRISEIGQNLGSSCLLDDRMNAFVSRKGEVCRVSITSCRCKDKIIGIFLIHGRENNILGLQVPKAPYQRAWQAIYFSKYRVPVEAKLPAVMHQNNRPTQLKLVRIVRNLSNYY